MLLDKPKDVRDGGPEEAGRPKWIIAGKLADGRSAEVVCALDQDSHGRWVVFISMY